MQDFLTAIPNVVDPTGIDSTTLAALKRDPIKRCRDLVVQIRASSQRREHFREVVSTLPCKQLELIRDMVVRWSSTYHMVDRYLDLQEVSNITGAELYIDLRRRWIR